MMRPLSDPPVMLSAPVPVHTRDADGLSTMRSSPAVSPALVIAACKVVRSVASRTVTEAPEERPNSG